MLSKRLKRAAQTIILSTLCATVGCTRTQMVPNLAERHIVPAANAVAAEVPAGERIPYVVPRGKRKLLVFMDGTKNQWNSRTNVRRLFEMVAGVEDPRVLSFYVEGVGADWHLLFGNGFGYGMQVRLEKAYAWLSEYHRDGDDIYIFGFSRGAHSARGLAGMIAHCGLIDTNYMNGKTLTKAAKNVTDWLQQTCEGTDPGDWHWAVSNRQPLYPTKLECESSWGDFPCGNRYAEVRFVGVWDTVPGTTFTRFGPAEELEGSNTGIRYKLGAYPPIRIIAHAVALDEQRKKFRPVLVPHPIEPDRTTVHEAWFPGAHSAMSIARTVRAHIREGTKFR